MRPAQLNTLGATIIAGHAKRDFIPFCLFLSVAYRKEQAERNNYLVSALNLKVLSDLATELRKKTCYSHWTQEEDLWMYNICQWQGHSCLPKVLRVWGRARVRPRLGEKARGRVRVRQEGNSANQIKEDKKEDKVKMAKAFNKSTCESRKCTKGQFRLDSWGSWCCAGDCTTGNELEKEEQ